MGEALAAEADAQRAALRGDWAAARPRFLEAARAYRASWAAAPPGSYGRLVGALKAAVEGGEGEAQARDALAELGDAAPESATAAYARAIAAAILGDDAAVARWTATMRGGSPAFGRAADGLDAVAAGDAAALQAAVGAIAEDFAGRDDHLTGVPFADTALLLALLGERRGLAVRRESALLPPAG